MPAYDVILIAANTKDAATLKLTNLLKTCAAKMWSRGAVVTEIRSWGVRDLAYRIRQRGVNHYRAQYLTIDLFCSPPALKELESTLRTNDLVLRWMSLRKEQPGTFDRAARQQRKSDSLAAHGEDAAAALEAAKYEYRNLVMQRVFEGKTKREILADQLAQHRVSSYAKSREIQRTSDDIALLRSAGVELSGTMLDRLKGTGSVRPPPPGEGGPDGGAGGAPLP
jgi:small subunit ribosomal protein S6